MNALFSEDKPRKDREWRKNTCDIFFYFFHPNDLFFFLSFIISLSPNPLPDSFGMN